MNIYFFCVVQGHLDALLRGLIIARLGKYGKADVVAEANKRFDAHCKGESAISADLRSAVYGTVLKHGDASSLDAMMKLFREADLHEEKVRLMRTMGNVSHPELIKKVLDFSMSASYFYGCFFFEVFWSAVFACYVVYDSTNCLLSGCGRHVPQYKHIYPRQPRDNLWPSS